MDLSKIEKRVRALETLSSRGRLLKSSTGPSGRPIHDIVSLLRELEQLDYQEIADTMQCAIGTVRSRISRGRDALAALVGNPDQDPRRPSEQR